MLGSWSSLSFEYVRSSDSVRAELLVWPTTNLCPLFGICQAWGRLWKWKKKKNIRIWKIWLAFLVFASQVFPITKKLVKAMKAPVMGFVCGCSGQTENLVVVHYYAACWMGEEASGALFEWQATCGSVCFISDKRKMPGITVPSGTSW